MAEAPTAEQTVFPEQGPLPQANGADFGAQVGAATAGLGEAVSGTGDVEFKHVMQIQNLKNEATASDMDIQFQGDLGKLEDGFYSLKGKAAADAYPQFQTDLTALRQKYLGATPNPMVANMLGQSVAYSVGRSLRGGGQYAGDQTKAWMINSADSRNQLLVSQGARNYADPDYQTQIGAALDAGAKNYAELNGLDPASEAVYRGKLEADLQKARTTNAKSYLQGLPIAQQAAALLGVQPGTPSGVGGDAYHRTVLAVEFGGGKNDPNNPHQGPMQADDDWWKRFGRGGDRNNTQDALKALDLETSVNKPQLETALQRPPTDGDLYLAHQQGLQGAINLLTHPDAPASQSVPLANIAANIPHDANGQPLADANTVTGQQFADLWQKPFAAAGANGVGQGTAPSAQDLAAVNVLSPDERQAMTKQALDNWRIQSNAAYEDQQHQQTVLDKAQKLQLDTADASIQKLMMAHDQDPTKQGVNLLQVAQSPLYADQPERIKQLMAFQRQLDKPDGEAGASARNTSQMFSKLFPSDGSTALSQKDIDAAFVSQDPNTHINKSDYDWLTNQVSNANDPVGKRINGQLNDVAKVVERQIDPSITGSMGDQTHSPFSGTRMLQWKQAVADKIAAFKAAGKDPAVLFDPTPGNKDYVGSAGFTAPYTRSLTDLMTEEATGAEAQPAAPVAAPAAVPTGGIVPAASAAEPVVPKVYTTLADLQAGINRHEISLTDAQRYAVEHGLARALAAKPAATGPAVPTAP